MELTDFSKFPKRFATMRPYLPGLQDKFESGTLFTSIYLGLDKEVDVFQQTAAVWFKASEHGGIYLHHVQAENLAVVGYLLYSMPSMDIKQLQKELELRLCFAVQARYQVINTGRNRDMKESEKVKAIHLRVDSNLLEEALDILGEIYFSTSKDFPLNHRMRLIPPVN